MREGGNDRNLNPYTKCIFSVFKLYRKTNYTASKTIKAIIFDIKFALLRLYFICE